MGGCLLQGIIHLQQKCSKLPHQINVKV